MFGISEILIDVIITFIVIVLFVLIIKSILSIRRDRLAHAKLVSLTQAREQLEDIISSQVQKYLQEDGRFEEMNKLFLSSHSIDNSDSVRNDSFFEGLGLKLKEMRVRKDQVMCIMPFHKKCESHYQAVRNVCMKLGLKTTRSDSRFESVNLIQYIVRMILESKYIIVDLSMRNSNVAFELGVAQTLGKMIIKIVDANNLSKLTFDAQTDNMIIFKGSTDLEMQLDKTLRLWLKDNPIDRFEISDETEIVQDYMKFVQKENLKGYQKVFDIHETLDGKPSPFGNYELLLSYKGTSDVVLKSMKEDTPIALRMNEKQRKQFIKWIEDELMNGESANLYYSRNFAKDEENQTTNSQIQSQIQN